MAIGGSESPAMKKYIVFYALAERAGSTWNVSE
jgi:hypothetical protein